MVIGDVGFVAFKLKMNYNQVMSYTIQLTDTFHQWLLKLKDKQAVHAINIRLARIREGNLGDTKSVGDGVFELRFFIGKGYRIYYTIKENKIIILLCGGHKDTQNNDIQTAKKQMKEMKQ